MDRHRPSSRRHGPVVALIGLELSGSAASNAGLLDEVIDPRNAIVFFVTLALPYSAPSCSAASSL